MIRFDELHKLFNRISKLTDQAAWKFSIDQKVKQFIISLNTHEQLGDEGIDSLGNSLGDYRPFTVQVRSSLGLQTDHVDFKVTGDYWRSWEVEVTNDGMIIRVDEERFDELVNELRFSEDHVGLTDENWIRIQEMIKQNCVEYIKRQILS